MTMSTTPRGRDLIEGSLNFARRPGMLARLVAPGFGKILDRIDKALVSGSIAATLLAQSSTSGTSARPALSGELHARRGEGTKARPVSSSALIRSASVPASVSSVKMVWKCRATTSASKLKRRIFTMSVTSRTAALLVARCTPVCTRRSK